MKTNAANHTQNTTHIEPNRLAHAQSFANELNESRLWKIKISYQKRWTVRHRARKSVEIQLTKPWRRSTGPKTQAGKTRARLNALHPDAGYHAMKHALRVHRHFLHATKLLTRMVKGGHPDAKPYEIHCHGLGTLAANALLNALSLGGYNFMATDRISRVTS